MLKRIVHPSRILVTFVTLVHLDLSKPQRKHLLRTAGAIIVCEGRKTLANLYRQWVKAPDASAVAVFFRVSPWEADEIYRALGPFVVADMLQRAAEEGVEPIIWASIDDSAIRKDKDAHAQEAVDWIFDHSASGKGQTAYCKGAVHVTLRIQIGSYSYTFAWRLYLREKTVRRLNRKRPKEKRLRFKSKYRLAREMLEELRALLPEGYTVYVLFDRWYGSGKLIKFILYWLLDSSMRILPSEWSILRKPGIMLINAKTYLESRNRMIETIIDAWKQLVNHLKQLVKHYAKPLTSGLVISALSDTTRSRVDLIAENALLRQQLIILKRQVKRPLLTQPERTHLVLLARCTRFWQQALHIVQPDTLLRWHRDLFRRYWRRKSRNKKPKPRIPAETIALIKQMTRENRLWGRNASGENC